MKIEFIIFTVIILILAVTCLFAFSSAKIESRNQTVLTDVGVISDALKIYHDENGFYPYGNGTPTDITNYLDRWPVSAVKCSTVADYNYAQKSAGDDYNLTFCLTKKTNNTTAGVHVLTSKGIN